MDIFSAFIFVFIAFYTLACKHIFLFLDWTEI